MKVGMTMENSKSYVEMLTNALEQKKEALQSISKITDEQAMIANQDDFNLEHFEETLNAKELYINRVQLLDDGFEGIYNRVKDMLTNNKSEYRETILGLQEIIREIAELGIEIQVQEQKNKQLIEKHLSKTKKQIKSFKKSRETANSYYKSMSKVQDDQSYFLDSKN